jgi:ribosomal protein L11
MISTVMGSKYIKKIFIRAASADPSPPLGTVLGNLGVQTTLFCILLTYLQKHYQFIFY